MATLQDLDVHRFIAGVVHGVRNPLHGINASVSALSCVMEDDPQARPFLDMITKEVTRLSVFMDRVHELLEDISPDAAPHSLTSILRDAVKHVEDTAKLWSSSCEFPKEMPEVHIRGDGTRLTRAFAAFLENSMESGSSRIQISLQYNAAGEAHVTIHDNGSGILQENLAKVMIPFFTTKPGKRGLGATIADRMIRAHHGSVRFERNDGPGASVHVTLPVSL